MERYQVILAYDGTEFQGFQRQQGTRTVQGVIEAALRQLGWSGRSILSAGRTDAGVHAAGQVIAFDLDWKHSPETLGRALNACLPQDVAVKAVRATAPDFHPRYDAVARCYHYRIYCQPARDPLRMRYAWQVEPPVDDRRLQEAADLLIGTHDFAAFGAPPKKGGRTVRTVYQANWRTGHQPDERVFSVTGNAFLYHMVRRMVYLQVQVARGQLSLDALAEELASPQVLHPGIAPANGLILERVIYPSDGEKPEGLRKTLAASGENGSGQDVCD